MKFATATTTTHFPVLLLLAAPLLFVGRAHAAEGTSGLSCACAAEKLGFSMDCTDAVAMTDALRILRDRDCQTDCTSSAECEANYYIVQAHHDGCPREVVPTAIEDGFHDFDQACVPCEIVSGVLSPSDADIATLSAEKDTTTNNNNVAAAAAAAAVAQQCPPTRCDAFEGNDAYTALIENGCNQNCASDICRDLFLLLKVVHDICDHDVLTKPVEEGFHDLERPCGGIHSCKVPTGGAAANGNGGGNPLVCIEHDHGSRDDDDSGATASSSLFSTAAFALVLAGTVAAATVV